jgi:hypothetical protein
VMVAAGHLPALCSVTVCWHLKLPRQEISHHGNAYFSQVQVSLSLGLLFQNNLDQVSIAMCFSQLWRQGSPSSRSQQVGVCQVPYRVS